MVLTLGLLSDERTITRLGGYGFDTWALVRRTHYNSFMGGMVLTLGRLRNERTITRYWGGRGTELMHPLSILPHL